MRQANLAERIEDVAGPPLAMRTTAGTTTLTTSQLGPYAARTMYIVSNLLAATTGSTSSQPICGFDVESGLETYLRSNSGPTGSIDVLAAHFQGDGGVGSSVGQGSNDAAFTGVRAIAAALPDGLVNGELHTRRAIAAINPTAAWNLFGGWQGPRVRLLAASSTESPMWGALFAGFHTAAQRREIVRRVGMMLSLGGGGLTLA